MSQFEAGKTYPLRGGGQMERHAIGDYVLFEDYERLQAELEQVRADEIERHVYAMRKP